MCITCTPNQTSTKHFFIFIFWSFHIKAQNIKWNKTINLDGFLVNFGTVLQGLSSRGYLIQTVSHLVVRKKAKARKRA